MTRIGRRLIEDFLLPALNDQRYGELLKWVDRDNRYFSIRWSHKNAAKWTLADTAVFQDWDRLKGHYRPEIKGYYMQAKQRFRAALYKLNSVRKLPCEDKHVKKYQLIMDRVMGDRRNNEFLIRPKLKIAKKGENQRSIPTSVIRKNTSYIERPRSENCSELPISPISSIKSEELSEKEEEEFDKCLYEYTLAQKKQQRLVHINEGDDTEASGVQNSPILRENPNVHRIPHVPIPPAPIYNSNAARKLFESSPASYESPQILLVRTYNDLNEEDPDVNEEPLDFAVECIISEPSSDTVLNLSVKSEDSETLSR